MSPRLRRSTPRRSARTACSACSRRRKRAPTGSWRRRPQSDMCGVDATPKPVPRSASTRRSDGDDRAGASSDTIQMRLARYPRTRGGRSDGVAGGGLLPDQAIVSGDEGCHARSRDPEGRQGGWQERRVSRDASTRYEDYPSRPPRPAPEHVPRLWVLACWAAHAADGDDPLRIGLLRLRIDVYVAFLRRQALGWLCAGSIPKRW